MGRIDDYINAKEIAAETLNKKSLDEIIKLSGFEKIENDKLKVPFLDRVYLLKYPKFNFSDESEPAKEVPIQEQVLILHYLLGQIPKKLQGRKVAYREIPGASFYFSAFVKRAIEPLKKCFGNNVSAFINACERLNGHIIKNGDACFEFFVFPMVPLQIVLWTGDEEFGAEANILFDDSIGQILSPEDIAWLSGMLVYKLVARG